MNATASAAPQAPEPAVPAPDSADDLRAILTPSTIAHLVASFALAGLASELKGGPKTFIFFHNLPPPLLSSFYDSLQVITIAVLASSLCAAACFSAPRGRNAFGILAAVLALGANCIMIFDRFPQHAAAFLPTFYLQILAALTLLTLSTESAVVKTVAIAARFTNSRKAFVFGHWFCVVSKAHFSTFDFYDALEKNLGGRRLPGVEWLRIKSFEAGLLSARREYLRIVRQRHIFDICASQFGTEYFFSCREGVLPVHVSPVLLFAFATSLFAGFGLLFSLVGFVMGLAGFGLLLVLGFGILRNLNLAGLGRVDALLLTLPGIGVLYEAWFRRETYFQEDTRVVFLALVNRLVREAVEVTTAERGVQLLEYHEHEPVLAELYHPRQKPLNPPPKRANHSSSP